MAWDLHILPSCQPKGNPADLRRKLNAAETPSWPRERLESKATDLRWPAPAYRARRVEERERSNRRSELGLRSSDWRTAAQGSGQRTKQPPGRSPRLTHSKLRWLAWQTSFCDSAARRRGVAVLGSQHPPGRFRAKAGRTMVQMHFPTFCQIELRVVAARGSRHPPVRLWAEEGRRMVRMRSRASCRIRLRAGAGRVLLAGVRYFLALAESQAPRFPDG